MNSPCFGCKKLEGLPGNAHSRCTAPTDEAAAMALWLQGHPAAPRANRHGVAQGWVLWPMNFDPIWIEECHIRPAIEAAEAAKEAQGAEEASAAPAG